MTRSYRARLSSNHAFATIPAFAAAITMLAVAPASAQQEEFKQVVAPSQADVPTMVVIAPGAPSSSVVVTPVGPSTAVVPATPVGGGSVIIAPSSPPAPAYAVIPAQPNSAPTVVAVPAVPQSTQVVTTLSAPPATEIITPAAAVAASMDWQAGHWESTDGITRSYVPGQYVPRQQGGSIWVPGRWQQEATDLPYHWVGGHWG